MDHEFDQKPEDSQDKHQQAKSSFADLQRLMEQFHITADEPEPAEAEEVSDIPAEDQPVLSVDELIERAAIASGEEPLEEPEEAAETEEESENSGEPAEPEEPQNAEEPAEPEEESEKPAEPEAEETEEKSEQKEKKKKTSKAASKKKVIRKKELKPAPTQEELEQQEREAILENNSHRRHPDQPAATVNLNKKTGKKASSTKKKKKNSKAAKARRRKKRMMRLCTAIVILLVAIAVVVSAVKALTRNAKNHADNGSAVVTEEDAIAARKKEGPASEQESEQYLAIKDDDSLPAYAKKYPGLYADAVSEPNVLSEEKVCYLTFDDGPSSTNTPGILDALEEANVKATFFVVASEINDETAPILQRIIEDGHTLGIHANEHEYSTIYASTEAYLADFAAAYDKIYELTGYRVQGFRFPGGSNGRVYKSGCYDNIVTEMTRRGFEYYDWNAYDHDAEGGNYTVEEIVDYAVHEVSISSRNDVILLMHDTYDKEKTVEALPSIISKLKEAGIEMLPITNSTRPVHFEVDDVTPPEYDEDAEETSSSDSSDDTDSASGDSDEN